VVSGGENLIPRPVQELLAEQPQVREAAEIGVPDPVVDRAPRAWQSLPTGSPAIAASARQRPATTSRGRRAGWRRGTPPAG
ncbi:hypothetical protein AB0J67_20320, partial [Catellatospora sp. NPDC049609]